MKQCTSKPIRFYPFRPNLSGRFMARFIEATTELANDPNEAGNVIVREITWAISDTTLNVRQRRMYRAIWLLLRDLLRVGWSCRVHERVFEVAPPNHEQDLDEQSRSAYKIRVRALMAPARAAKLRESQAFIERMESPTSNGRPTKSIRALIADPVELADSLRAWVASDDTENLPPPIRPELELVSEGVICPDTNLKLNDIWRYFRLFWATPPENTPGRTMLYLIRDSSRPHRPVIGIASLENSPLRLAVRDYSLGWSKEAFLDGLADLSTTEVREKIEVLIGVINDSIGEISLHELCSPEETINPTEQVIAKLASIVARTNKEKEEALRRWRERDELELDEELEKSDLGDVSMEFEEALYRRKRADMLGRLLTAKRFLMALISEKAFEETWQPALVSESGQSAIWIALIGLKNRHVGTSIMELNVCGAIPPYNDLLAGKLVALLALSPQIVADYRERYGSRASDIASRMKGERVVRPAELVFLGTTSLYRGNSSQYNRLKLPAGLFGEGSSEIHWQVLRTNRSKGDLLLDSLLKRGETSGYGTLHIGRDTLQALDEATDVTTVNHAFGEGSSPKLRMIRYSLERLLDPGQRGIIDEITRHSMNRIVYGAFLARNAKEVLTGREQTPDHSFGDCSPAEGTRTIIAFWCERWLRMRAKQPDILQRVRSLDAASFILGRQLDGESPTEFTEIRDMSAENHAPGDWRDFVRLLSGGTSAFADRTDIEWLNALHVPTSLDEAIVEAARNGKDVILTGNPGDGKTHLLRVLESRLTELPNKPSLLLDASALSDSDVMSRWNEAASAGRPFCAAVNEAVLYTLARVSDLAPANVAYKSARLSVVYDDSVQEDAGAAVFDLSRRNTLDPDIVRAVRDKLLDQHRLTACSSCSGSCDALRHAAALRDDIVLERLQGLLDRVSATGHHFTIRQLQAFFSQLLFADRSCVQLLQTSQDSEFDLPNLVFSSRNAISKALLAVCDPSRISHPILDEQLLLGNIAEGWESHWNHDNQSLDPSAVERFVARKRAYYFYHVDGAAVFEGANSDELAFSELLSKPERDIFRHLLRRVNAVFGDEHEQDHLWAWQSHHYDQNTSTVFFSVARSERSEMEVVKPRLAIGQRSAFNTAVDHVVFRLRKKPDIALRVDFPMFKLLEMAARGVPVLSLPGKELRHLQAFLERLARGLKVDEMEEVRIRLRDLGQAESLDVRIAVSDQGSRYMSVQSQGGSGVN